MTSTSTTMEGESADRRARRARRASPRRWIIVAGVVILVGAALGLELRGHRVPRAAAGALTRPVSVVPGPRGIVSATAPGAAGQSWVLTATPSASNLQLENVSTGSISDIVATPLHSHTVAQAVGGPMGLGEGVGHAGTVEFLRAGSSKPLGVVAVSGPVTSLVAGADGVTFYALEDVGANRAVAVIDSSALKVTASLPMPSDAVAIAVDPGQSQIFALGSGGLTSIISITTGKVISQFPTGASGRALAISPDGSTLYVLDGSPVLENVAVVDVATQSIVRYLPAPRYTAAIAASIDNSTLADFVGTPSMGNVQLFRTGR